MNVIAISGNLTRDPEVKNIGSTSLTVLSIAHNNDYKKNGEWVKKPCYLNVEVQGKSAESAVKLLSKGMKIEIVGEIHQDFWETDGGKRDRHKIRFARWEFGESRKEQEARQGAAPQAPAESPQEAAFPEGVDDDLPF